MEGSVVWDIRVSIDLFLGGIGIALFLFSVILSYYNKERYEKLIRISAYLAPVVAAIGLLALVTELGKPFRMIFTYVFVNPQSVTSWGSFLQGAFLLGAAVYALLLFTNKASGTLFNAVKIAGTILAVSVGMYHGLLLTSVGIPLWADGSIVVLFLAASLSGGTACVMLLKSVMTGSAADNKSEDAIKAFNEVAVTSSGSKYFNFNSIFFFLITSELIAIVSWFVAMIRGSSYQLESIQAMLANFGGLFWILAVTVGIIIPFVLSLYQIVNDSKNAMPKGLSMIIFLTVIIGSFTLKYIIIEAGQIEIPIQFL